MTVLEVLKGARAKIAHGWTQGYLARQAGRGLWYSDLESGEPSDCWCASGAIIACTRGNDDARKSAWEALRLAAGLNAGGDIPSWNDRAERTQADVLAAFDKAIAAEEAKS